MERRLSGQEEMELLHPLSCRAEALGTAPLRVSQHLASGTRGPPATDARLTPHTLGAGFLAGMDTCKVMEQPGPRLYWVVTATLKPHWPVAHSPAFR